MAGPTSDREAVHAALDELTPAGGSLAALEALHAATLSLSSGANPAKKIVLITDGQRIGWDLSARQRWAFLSEAARALTTPPMVIVRTLRPPRTWRNAAVTGLSLSRAVVGTDRPVKITVTVANTAQGPVAPDGVELRIDGKAVETRPLGSVAEGAAGSVIFEHRFERPGPHVVSARVLCQDDLPADNLTRRVVNVLSELPVLIVEGKASTEPLGGDADFLMLALAPPGGEGEQPRHLVRPTVVSAADIRSVGDFSRYAVVVLADVPRLPGKVAVRLGEFVAGGGGLLIAPGEKAEPAFYNAWSLAGGKRLTGCKLEEVRTLPAGAEGQQRCAHVAVNAMDHPALKLLSDASGSDLAGARVKRYWVVVPDEEDEAVSVGASLDDGRPLLVQRKCGRGFVLTLALPLDRSFCDLPVRESYVPLVHELVYFLAAPLQRPMNLLPGQQIVYTIPGKIRSGDVVEVLCPDGRRMPARLRRNRGRWEATYALTARPGLYRLHLPDEAAGEPGGSVAPSGAASAAEAGCAGLTVPFVVVGNPDESRLKLLEQEDYGRAGQFLELARVETLAELTAALTGGVPGSEIWKYVAVALLAGLVAEIAVTRAIAVHRKTHLARPVVFGTGQVDMEEVRATARAALGRKVEGRGEVTVP